MVYKVLKVLWQGLWSSVTGGSFYDPHLSRFQNATHLYLWIFLLCFPLYLHFVSILKLF